MPPVEGVPSSNQIPLFVRDFEGLIQVGTWIKSNFFGVTTAKKANIDPAFVEAVQRYRQTQISIFYNERLIDLSFARQRQNGSWDIAVPACFNYCYSRFAVCKELCHILTDDGTVRAIAPSEQIAQAWFVNLVIQSSNSRFLEMMLTMRTMPSEFFCFFLALEIMIPDSKRDEIIQKYTHFGFSANDIAKELSIPETIIEFYLESYHRMRTMLLHRISARLQ